MPVERRKATRCRVPSRVIFRTAAAQEAVGQLVDVAPVGARFSTAAAPVAGTQMWMQFNIAGKSFIAPAELVRNEDGQVCVVFRQEPFGLRHALDVATRNERRHGRVSVRTMLRVRRLSAAEAEVVQPVDVSRTGIGFESVREYEPQEKVLVTLHYDPARPESSIETPAEVVRVEPLDRWDAYGYGLRFVPLDDPAAEPSPV